MQHRLSRELAAACQLSGSLSALMVCDGFRWPAEEMHEA
jgi:hypothetical protein